MVSIPNDVTVTGIVSDVNPVLANAVSPTNIFKIQLLDRRSTMHITYSANSSRNCY